MYINKNKISYGLKINNEEGSISLSAFPLMLLIISFGIYSLSKSLEEYNLTKFRTKAYLCTKSSINNTVKLYDNLTTINKALGIIAPLAFSPLVKKYYTLKKILTRLADFQITFFLMNMNLSRFCHTKEIIHILSNRPYEGIISPKRNSLGQIKMRKQWQNYLVFTTKKALSPLINSFIINLKFRSKNSRLSLSTKELNMVALRRLKQLYGLVSSVQ